MIPLRCLVATLFVGLFPCLGALAEDEPMAPALRRSPFAIDDSDTRWWSFQPVRRPAVPAGAHPIDALLHQHLRARNLTMSPLASPREQVRRLFYDVVGLPPSHAEIVLFEQDPSPDAWARLVDRLLSRPEFGERWARHWLDLVRFAETNGYERDGTKPEASPEWMPPWSTSYRL